MPTSNEDIQKILNLKQSIRSIAIERTNELLSQHIIGRHELGRFRNTFKRVLLLLTDEQSHTLYQLSVNSPESCRRLVSLVVECLVSTGVVVTTNTNRHETERLYIVTDAYLDESRIFITTGKPF